MANNRLYIVDTVTGDKVLLVKGYGGPWGDIHDLDKLNAFFSEPYDCEASRMGATKLKLMTEDELSGFASRDQLIVGRFYWVMPTLDPDAEGEWESGMQPARFAGRNAEGGLLWNCLAIEGVSDWPMKWIGKEIDAQPVSAG